jgi:hypothetical protein
MRLKNWGILSQVFCHHILWQCDDFWVWCAMATWLTIERMVSRKVEGEDKQQNNT